MELISHRGISKNCPRTTITTTTKPKGGFGVPYAEAQLLSMFKSFDTDKDGRLSRQELEKLFNNLGSRFSWWRVRRAVHYADENKDGYVSEEEFSQLVWYILNKCDYKAK